MSPLLFIIYINPLIRKMNENLIDRENPDTHLHAYIDDIALVSPHPEDHRMMLRLWGTDGHEMGLSLNDEKSELHSMGDMPPLNISVYPTEGYATRETITLKGTTTSGYKYLGCWITRRKDPGEVVRKAET